MIYKDKCGFLKDTIQETSCSYIQNSGSWKEREREKKILSAVISQQLIGCIHSL